MSDGWGAAPGAGGQQPQDGPQAGQQQPQQGQQQGQQEQPQGGAPWPGQSGGPQASAPTGTTPQGLPQRGAAGQQPPSPFPAHATGQPSGYGYPQQGQGYGYPQQGYPQGGFAQQPGPYATPANLPRNPSEPDWAALADQNDAASRRRKRLYMVGGGVLAALVVGGIVAVSLGVLGKGKDVAAGPSTSPSVSTSSLRPSPSPSTPPPPPVDPLDIISSAAKDTARLDVRVLFPDVQVPIGGTVYERNGVHQTATCVKAGSNGLGEVFVSHKCRAVYRATYLNKGIAVTVAIVVFDDAQQAQAVVKKQTGNIFSLYRKPLKPFCRGVQCLNARGSAGRYAYFTLAGYTNGKAVPKHDKNVEKATDDILALARNTLLQRGRLAAARSAAAATTPAG